MPGKFYLSYGSYAGFNRDAFFSDANKIEYSKSNCTATFKFAVSEAGTYILSLEASNGNTAGTYNTDLSVKSLSSVYDSFYPIVLYSMTTRWKIMPSMV